MTRGSDQFDSAPSRSATPDDDEPGEGGRLWLGVYFHCCHVYGRIYKRRDGQQYEGVCPRCGGRVSAVVGPDGTSRRMFEAS